MSTIEKAIEIAANAHAGQVDNAEREDFPLIVRDLAEFHCVSEAMTVRHP